METHLQKMDVSPVATLQCPNAVPFSGIRFVTFDLIAPCDRDGSWTERKTAARAQVVPALWQHGIVSYPQYHYVVKDKYLTLTSDAVFLEVQTYLSKNAPDFKCFESDITISINTMKRSIGQLVLVSF